MLTISEISTGVSTMILAPISNLGELILSGLMTTLFKKSVRSQHLALVQNLIANLLI
jgi:hypothetical protein